MRASLRYLPVVLVVLASAWIASTITGMGDWEGDSRPAVQALTSGDISGYLSAEAMMGPVATLLQAPFAAVGGDQLDEYRWAAFPCLLALGLLGLYLAGIVRRRGGSKTSQVLLAGLCLVNPLTFEALELGHPEELLTAALAIGAVASGAEGHRWRAAILLGLALASKQWAVVAILPVLMTLPGQRIRVGVTAAAIAAVLMLPGVITAFGSFSEVQGNAAHTGRVVTPWNVWYPLAGVETETYAVGSTTLTANVREAPPLVGPLSHPLIVLLAFALPLALALYRRSFTLTGSDAMALLALVVLLRCVLDPVGNLYYHVPLLLTLFGWDAFDSRSLPLRGLTATALALLFWEWWHNLTNVAAFNAVYVAVASIAGAAILLSLWRRPQAEAGKRATGLTAYRLDGIQSGRQA